MFNNWFDTKNSAVNDDGNEHNDADNHNAQGNEQMA